MTCTIIVVDNVILVAYVYSYYDDYFQVVVTTESNYSVPELEAYTTYSIDVFARVDNSKYWSDPVSASKRTNASSN